MLISKETEIIADNSNIKRYEELGYGKLKQGDKFIIKIEHIKQNSNCLVDVECDYCGDRYIRKYNQYNANIKNDTKKENRYCCKKCTPERYRESCLLTYGVDNTSKLKEIHEKIKETCKERYNDANYRNPNKTKQTKFEKYGDEVYVNREKYKQTCLERFGFENASQCPEIFDKQQKARLEIKKYKDTDLYYQGTYEKDFLDKYYDKFVIERMTSLKYNFNGSE